MALIQSQASDRNSNRVEKSKAMGVPLRQFRFSAMGAPCSLQFACDDDRMAENYQTAVVAWVQNFEARYTRFRDDSVVGRINLGAGNWIEVDDEMDRMLDLSGSIHFMTQGVLDVTAGPLSGIWNYQAESPRVPSPEEVNDAMDLVGWNKVERTPGKVKLPRIGMSLDFGGWGKEYAVDVVAGMAAEYGIAEVLVDFGHDIRAMGTPPGRPAWHIGLEDPKKVGGLWGSIAVGDGAVASSGDYQRGFTIDGQRYGHIIDPRDGRPATHGLRQVTVVAPTCLQAGMLSTTAFVLGPEKGLDLIQETMGAEGCMVSSHAKHQTRGFFHYVVS